jgi:hypothetical protein
LSQIEVFVSAAAMSTTLLGTPLRGFPRAGSGGSQIPREAASFPGEVENRPPVSL